MATSGYTDTRCAVSGKIDAIDKSPLHAALREAEEEVGLSRDFIEPIGYLDLYGTAFGFRILPTAELETAIAALPAAAANPIPSDV